MAVPRGLLWGLLELGRGRCRASSRITHVRSVHASPAEHLAETSQQAAKSPATLPHGRLYIPSALAAASQLPQSPATSLPQQQGCVSITVQCSSSSTPVVVIKDSSQPAALSLAARAAATGTWPTLPTWLFGFACGSAAATAMAFNYLNPQGAVAGAVHGAVQLSPHADSASYQQTLVDSSGSSSMSDRFPLTNLSYPGGCSSSSGSSSGNSWNSSVWAYVQQLARLGSASAHAAAHPYPDSSRLLPTPWEPAEGSSSSDAITDAAADAGGSRDAVLLRSSISSAAAAAAPAVVHLVAAGAAAGGPSAALVPGLMDSRAQGSGFIYDPQGYILTNAHVVLGTAPTAALSASATAARGPKLQHSSSWRAKAEGSTGSTAAHVAGGLSHGGILVHMQDGRVFDGRLVAIDRASDLAVVQVDAREPLPYCKLGNSHRLSVGEWVVALGSPFLLKQSVTAGIVSCVERKGSELGLSSPRTEFIQTDAAINVGNSGGPLVNLDGEVVGMNNMKAAAADGVSFAIPINTIKQLVSEISRHGRVRRPYVGITMAEVKPSRMAQLRTACPDFPRDVVAGIVVTRVAPGSPAAAAGLREDDVIVGLQGAKPGDLGAAGVSVSSLADALKDFIGSSLELLVVREQYLPGKQHEALQSSSRYAYVTVTIKPVEAPAS